MSVNEVITPSHNPTTTPNPWEELNSLAHDIPRQQEMVNAGFAVPSEAGIAASQTVEGGTALTPNRQMAYIGPATNWRGKPQTEGVEIGYKETVHDGLGNPVSRTKVQGGLDKKGNASVTVQRETNFRRKDSIGVGSQEARTKRTKEFTGPMAGRIALAAVKRAGILAPEETQSN